MRKADKTTRDALRSLLKEKSVTEVARLCGIHRSCIYDALDGNGNRTISIKRENDIRKGLGLPPLNVEYVLIDPDRQKVVNIQAPRPYVSRQIRIPIECADEFDALVRLSGASSFNGWWNLYGADALQMSARAARRGVESTPHLDCDSCSG